MKLKIQLFITCMMTLIVVPSFGQSNDNNDLEKRTQALEKAVKTLSKVKVSGYIQTQFQSGQENASLKVGSGKASTEDSFNRIGVRRGRVKFTFEEGITSAVFQLDFTDKGGVKFKDAYLNVKDPWFRTSALRAGIFDRPFGYEIDYSSSRRESPERSAIFQMLFPDERDLGAMLILQPSKESSLHALKFQGGLFAGNGIKADVDNRKDFIGQLRIDNNLGQAGTYGIGISTYLGGVLQQTEDVYTMKDKSFVVDSKESNKGKYAKRQYFGVDGQIALKSDAGQSKLTAEYIFGKQPGTEKINGSITDLIADDIYIRNISGGYVMFVQDLGRSPFQAVVKFDWLDLNTKISGNEVKSNADRSQNTIGFGLLWNATKDLRLQAYYEVNNFEKSEHLDKVKADVFTLRLQYKF
ncbi:MAG: OprO/OprP family phosphate-selective porin [Tannerellaceae bacterium]|nr:OprO/OprP family phosphate-selective porin [Tannerellaceae bacterium]